LSPLRISILLVATVSLLATRLEGQALILEGDTLDPAAALIERILRDDDYLYLERDTVLGPGADLPGDLLVVGARVSLEGRIAGAVGVIEGDFFVRPSGIVGGPIAVIGFGGVYPSGRAHVGETLHLDPRIEVTLRRDGPTSYLRLRPPPARRTLRLPDLYGLGVPTYDRVDGLSIPWRGQAGLGGGDTARVTLNAGATFRTARSRVDPAASIEYRPVPRSLVTLAAGRRTRTTESWIRGDLANTITALGVASDVRDYFRSDEVSLTVARTPPPPLILGEWFVAPLLSARISRDRSLEATRPWSLVGGGDDWRVNPFIDEGTLASLVAGARFGWRGAASELSGAVATEWAPSGIGDFAFAQASTKSQLWMRALWDHQLRITAYLLHPLGANEAPLQRWSFVGGPGTLPTFDTGRFRGDRVVSVNSVYFAPVPGVHLPLAGQPAIRIEHAFGMAWRTGDPRPPLEQNLGVGIQIVLFNAMLFIDPAERPRRLVASFGARLPASITIPIL
jgi:hypothetical protein